MMEKEDRAGEAPLGKPRFPNVATPVSWYTLRALGFSLVGEDFEDHGKEGLYYSWGPTHTLQVLKMHTIIRKFTSQQGSATVDIQFPHPGHWRQFCPHLQGTGHIQFSPSTKHIREILMSISTNTKADVCALAHASPKGTGRLQ
jgi:hypothetical protein